MHFLSVKELAVEYGASYEPFAGPWDGKAPYALCNTAEAVCSGLEGGVFLAMGEILHPQVSRDRDSGCTRQLLPGPAGGDSRTIDLFF